VARSFNGKLIFICILLFSVLVFCYGCEPGGKLTIINQSNQDAQIFVAKVLSDGTTSTFTKEGDISNDAVKSIYVVFLGNQFMDRIEIRDLNGNILFSHDYTMSDMDKIGWKIIIPS
jgi:hypothetical protein